MNEIYYDYVEYWTPNDLKRFFDKVEKSDNCWLWTATKSHNGYGQFYFNGKLIYSHRFVYQVMIGDIPKGLDLDHLCRVRNCVNPDHLEPVTRQENLSRGKINQHKNKTHCKRGHKFTNENTRITTKGSRQCLNCVKMRIKIG